MFQKALLLLVLCNAMILTACSNGSSKKVADGDISLLGGACDTSGVDGSSQLSGVVNGSKLGPRNAISNRVVSIIFKNGEQLGLCTGSLLPGNVVLTAAHCVPKSKSTKEIFVAFTNNLSCITNNNKQQLMRLVTNLKVDEDYSGDADADHDIAMLRFSGDVPAGYEAFDIPSLPVVIAPTDRLIMAGYGVTEYNGEDSKVLRVTSIKGNRLALNPNKSKSFVIDQHDTGVCSGDSGGPLMVYKHGRLQIVGIASSVSNSPFARENELCNSKSYYVDVSKQLDWINTTYKSL